MTSSVFFRRYPWLWLLCLIAVVSAPSLRAAEQEQLNLLLLEVRLDSHVLSGAIPAYDQDGQVLLPLGELARLLTIAVQTRPDGTASGFVLQQDRSFSLNVADAQVSRAGSLESFDRALIVQEPDDIYVAVSLLERWFPLELAVDRSSQVLKVQALEELPLQARLRRERLAERSRDRGSYEAPQYPFHHSPYQLLDTPFIDQTLAFEAGETNDEKTSDARYSMFLSGDFLGLESSVHFSASERERDRDLRVTVGRRDPEADLLGPLNARSYSLGSYTSPSIENILHANTGEGITISNRPLTQPTQFDRQTFEGALPPGWDVELYYNNALVDYQQANSQGLYRFENLPLSYGRNDFQLVFNGPLGQTRVENYSYSLDQSMVRPGEFRYSLGEHRDDDGQARSIGQFDLGLSRNLSVNSAFIRAPIDGEVIDYSSVGLRTFWQSVSVNGNYIRAEDGGQLTEFGLQTRLFGTSLDVSRLYLDNFISDEFRPSSDPITTRDEVRLSGSIGLGKRRLPFTFEFERDERESGITDSSVSHRLSAYAFRTAISNTLNWRSQGGLERTTGNLLLSRRVYDVGLRGSVDYDVQPYSQVSGAALTADYELSRGYRLTAGVRRNLLNPLTTWSAGLSKSLGRYGLGLSTHHSSDGNYGVGLQFSIGLGQEPRTASWLASAQPTAGYGAVSARMFLDANGNGKMDVGEEPIPDSGFHVNGGSREVRTDANGIAQLGRLPVGRYVDVGVDRSTLLDPQWEPMKEGVSVVPRPGHVAQVDFPVRVTSEIDGTVFLLEGDVERGIGGMELQLLDAQMEVVSEATSAWDGFYIMPAVPGGDYYLRMAPDQLKRLDLLGTGIRVVTVSSNGDYVSGMDMLVQRRQAKTFSALRKLQSVDKPKNAAPRSTQTASGGWISQQSANNYTIQLLATSAESAVEAFMAEHGIQRQSAYFESRFQGGPWFSLVYGSYRSIEAAQRALDDLPASLKGASPWIRQFRSIHQIIDHR